MIEYLTNLSYELAGVVETAGQGVVRVDARRRLPASGVVWSEDGIIVTTHHIVRRDENIEVGLPGGETVKASLVGRDPTTDLAVLRADASALKPAEWADLADMRVGHLVLALGRPGCTVQATLGIVSALGESWRTPAGGAVDRYLQTDVVMYPGFSGGATFDAAGKALGINSSALLRGASVALPVPTLRRVVETLLTHGRVRRGFLGIGAQPVRLPKELAEKLNQEIGLLLISVDPASPAENGGLLVGDIVVRLDGQPLRRMDDLLALLSGDRVGVETPVQVVRGGELRELAVVIGERP